MFRLAKLSLANRALIALITVFAAVFGVITMSSLKQELIPSIEFPQISVITAMPGASPEVVDKQLSRPLEAALNSVEGLESTTSTSRNGVSQISMVFTYGSIAPSPTPSVCCRPTSSPGLLPAASATSRSCTWRCLRTSHLAS